MPSRRSTWPAEDREDFGKVYWRKVSIYGLIFVFFVVEGFLAEDDLGRALSFGPLLSWMVILTVVATMYRLFGWKGVGCCFIAQMFLWTLPMPAYNYRFQEIIWQVLDLPNYGYDAKLDLFFGSGCLGFLIGYYHYHFRGFERTKQPILIAASLVAFVPWLIWGWYWTVDPNDFWLGEYDVASTFLGILSIWAIITMLLGSVLLFEERVGRLEVPVLNWCGVNCLLIFAVHRVFFVRFLAPLREHFGDLLDIPMRNRVDEHVVFVALTVLAAYAIRQSRILDVIDPRGEVRGGWLR